MKYIGAVIVFFALCAGAWYFFTHRSEPFQPAFFAEGNLVKDNPGMMPGTWYLVYEEPGFAALSVPLLFDTESKCGLARELRQCDIRLLQGDRVSVEGVRDEDRVVVSNLIFTKPDERRLPIRLYYFNPEKDTDTNGNILCSAQGLQYVERIIPHTQTPLTEAIKLLLRGDISGEEKAAGATSEFPMLGVRLEKAAIQNGLATLTFSDEQNKTSGGSCRVAILRAQIEATAKQFPGVTEVRLEPAELFQP